MSKQTARKSKQLSPSVEPLSTVTSKESLSAVSSKEDEKPKIVVNEKEKKKQAFLVRTLWTIVMISGMFFIICAGHFWTICFVLLLQVLVFKELIGITSESAKNSDLKYTGYLNWYLLITTICYLEGKSLMTYLINYLIDHNYPTGLAVNILSHNKFISYLSYVLAFVGFVSSLKKGYLKFQFAQLCITHMILLLVIFQGHTIVNNILHGLIWFLLPVGLVITNDIFAYICGITFGKTQLISISPKKTVEGFVGAWVCTTFMSVILTYYLCNYNYFICPVNNYNDFSVNCLTGISCDPNPVFLRQIYKIPTDFVKFLGTEYIHIKPIYLHSMVLSMFASLIAPFGGFFASGLKRAFKIKDFGDTIPGHGGVTDRMDCQFLMGSFSYLYYETFISTHQLNIGTLLQTIVINLSGPDILILVKSLFGYLHTIDLITEEAYVTILGLL
ncbi:hypothetical protein CANARDRAFT_9554 [[Candida] arabinofermentans NRRL YB-2248]|uniref:Phosphatidate cytidylyltransferase n=1 Tax=[Candida] arabinofermentans NRRL YB-2248 TaxID=983967 RepID=A0A1E4SVG2_9ASCO|nr:hypothetical protein CANARDRAFT_9554 [[Candida] arabinofermentans NRRL YB-2248]